MVRLIRVAAIVLLGTAMLSHPAGAIVCSNCEQEAMAVLRQIDQLRQWSSQLKAMADQLTQLKDTHRVLSHVTSLAGANGALGGFTRQAGPSGSTLPRLMNGSGSEWGTANTRLREDRLYAPADSDEWSTEMERRERVTANAKAMAEAAYTDAEEQLAQLDALRAEVEAAPDVTAVTAQSAAVALAHQRLSANQAMLEQARLLLTADDRVTQQRSEQRWRRDVDAWVKKTAPALEGW
jgi:hypothetical protein